MKGDSTQFPYERSTAKEYKIHEKVLMQEALSDASEILSQALKTRPFSLPYEVSRKDTEDVREDWKRRRSVVLCLLRQV